jgi:dCMP deaminase
MKEKYLRAMMEMTIIFGQTSESKRLKVGASLVKNNAIISLGVNGTPAGWYTNDCEDGNGETQWFVKHAEAACLDKLVHSTESASGAIMLISHAPCKFCSIRIKDAGINRVYYRYTYRDLSGIDYLMQNHVIVEQI